MERGPLLEGPLGPLEAPEEALVMLASDCDHSVQFLRALKGLIRLQGPYKDLEGS